MLVNIIDLLLGAPSGMKSTSLSRDTNGLVVGAEMLSQTSRAAVDNE